MIEIEMSKDVREFSPKVLGPFDKRQLIVILLTVLVGIPVVLLLGPLPLQFKMIVAVIVTMPIILCGWVKIFGMPLEVFVFKFVIPNTFSPRKKKYMTENTYEAVMVSPGEENPFKTEPVLRNIQRPKLDRKQRKIRDAQLKQFGAAK